MRKFYFVIAALGLMFYSISVKSQSVFEVITPFNQSVFVSGVTQDSWGNILVFAETTIGGGPFGGGQDKLVLMKHNSDGNLMWTRYYETPTDDGIYHISIAAQGDFYALAGYTIGTGTNSRDGLILITDTAGTVVQTIRADHAGGSNAYHSIAAAEEGWVLSGRSNAGAGGSYDLQLTHLQTDGTPVFSKTYGGNDWDWAYWAEPFADGYVMAGYGDSFGGGFSDPFLIRTDSVGEPIWARTISTPAAEDGLFVTSDSQGNIFLTGYTLGMIPGNPQNKGFIAKFSSDGELIWCRAIPGWLSIPSMCVTSDDRIIVVGDAVDTPDGLGQQDIGLVLLSTDGDVLQGFRYGSSAADYVSHVITLDDGNILIAGGTSGFGSAAYKPYLIKATATGVADCNFISYDFPATPVDVAVIAPVFVVSEGISHFEWSVSTEIPVADIDRLCCPPDAIASFELAGNNSFINTSENATQINWYVDGELQSATDDILVFDFEPGIVYEICLVASNPCSADEVCEEHIFELTNVNSSERNPYSLIPNPSNGTFRFSGLSGPVNLRIMDLNGRLIIENGIVQPDELIRVDLPAGLYLGQVSDIHENHVLKLVIR
jgi:hypothetical protein